MREHDVTALTARELEHARRELAASLALTRPGSRPGTDPGDHERHRHRTGPAGPRAGLRPYLAARAVASVVIGYRLATELIRNVDCHKCNRCPSQAARWRGPCPHCRTWPGMPV